MVRPTLIVAETEPLAALSVRKLVLESAKFNVLTAHSSEEAVEILNSSPSLVRALVAVADLKQVESLVAKVKQARPELPIIYIAGDHSRLKQADYFVSHHDPHGLVQLCRTLFGDPRRMETDPRGK